MSDQIVQLRACDFEEAISFLNRAYGRINFATFLPGLYQPTDHHMGHNLAIRRDGRLVSVVGVFPIQWQVGDRLLRVAGIGGVSTDPDCRRQGLMQRLMEHAVELIGHQGYDLTMLGGQRQRYRHFGWEKAGLSLVFQINPKNIEHDIAGRSHAALKIEPLPDDDQTLAELRRLHDAQPSHCRRLPASFGDFLGHWNLVPNLVRDGQGRIAGYFVFDSESGSIAELVATDSHVAIDIVAAWSEATAAPIHVQTAPWPDPFIHRMAAIAEVTTLTSSGNWQIVNWPATVGTLLAFQHRTTPLVHGLVRVRINDANVTIQMRVDGSGSSCQRTCAEPDLEADACTVVRLLFGPTRPSAVMRLGVGAAILEAWCPLPLRLSRLDHV